MKRKDFENAYDDEFSCFALAAASARKSRRLDCELPPIIEEEFGSGVPMVPDQGFLHESSFAEAALVPNEALSASPVVVNDPPSEELAIVLYNPENAAAQGMVKSPSSTNLSLVMNPELLSGWKNHMLRQGNQSRLTITELDEESDEYKSFESNNSMAVVPWVASQQHQYWVTDADAQAPVMSVEPMEADADCEMMEFDDNSSAPGYNNQGYNTMNNGGAEIPLPLQQLHCLMPPQYAPNTCTPIPW